MTEAPFTPDELARYAAVIIDRCLDLRRGELLLLNYECEHRPLAVAIARAAYQRGLRVEPYVIDNLMVRAEVDLADDDVLGTITPWRIARALARTEEGAASLIIDGDADPDAFDGCDLERMALRQRRIAEQQPVFHDRLAAGRDAFAIVAYPTAAWAQRVFPDLPVERAQRALAEDVLSFCRIGPDDGAGDRALAAHIAELNERAATANRMALRELRYRGPGTDLRVGLTQDSLWISAHETNAFGRTLLCNLPTEEIYTSPAASATEGTVRCTLPLAWEGILYEDVRLEFRGGRLVRLDARTDEQRDSLLGLLDVDDNGRRLGEVALVDARSRIGRRGLLYWNTLLDENQACHVALGLGFVACRRDRERSRDLNLSRAHMDVMIGSPEVEVTGTTARGEAVTLISDGVWRPA